MGCVSQWALLVWLITWIALTRAGYPDASCTCQCQFFNDTQPTPRNLDDDDDTYCTGPPALYASRLCDTYNVSDTDIEPCYTLDTPILCQNRWSQAAVLREPSNESNAWLIGARFLAATSVYKSQTGIFSGAQMDYLARLWDGLHELLEIGCDNTLSSKVDKNSTRGKTPAGTPRHPLPYVPFDDASMWSQRLLFILRTLRVLGGIGPQCRSVGRLNPWSARAVDAQWKRLTVPPDALQSPVAAPTQSQLPAPPPSSCPDSIWSPLTVTLTVFSILSAAPWILMLIAAGRRCKRRGVGPCPCQGIMPCSGDLEVYDAIDIDPNYFESAANATS